ncbi:hypothetical protein C1280_17830 [Gemmata obscuriglobus]|uniref:HTH lysR-type domain-containing protein n=1 Tax=Gemmata obscuriglobus TaxID=114 RepID=A0A2Z3HBS2_9BACT|nr:hypothetical protein C1280_17830 [Gemmata obscuriglobus]
MARGAGRGKLGTRTTTVVQTGRAVAERVPSVSTDQVAALVELARAGSLRTAAIGLHLTEQGLRNRLVALETALKVPLYHKQRGPRRRSPLTPQGELFLPHAVAFLEAARRFGERAGDGPQEIHVAATQYLTMYAMLDAVRRFHRAFPATPRAPQRPHRARH